MALFHAAIEKDTVSLLRFLNLSLVLVISNAVSPNCHLKYSSSYFLTIFIFLILLFYCLFL